MCSGSKFTASAKAKLKKRGAAEGVTWPYRSSVCISPALPAFAAFRRLL